MPTIKRVAALVFLSICWTATAPPARAEGVTLAQVIANVESNEQLYRDIEVIRTEEYRLLVEETSKDNLITTQKRQRRSVIQGPMFYLKVTGGHDLINKKSYDLYDLYGYDGEVTRYVAAGGSTTDPNGKHQGIANINHKRLNPCDIFVPHTWLISGASPCITPLSVCLRGGKEFENYPGNSRHKDQSWQTFLEGEEEVDGLRCVKLRMDSYDIQGSKLKFNTRRFLWLAIDRSYLPLKTTAYDISVDSALEEASAKDFRQIGPDIWLSFEKQIISYDFIALQKDKNNRVVRNRVTEKIELAKLDPKYDISFFRNIEVPTGAAVYELDKDQIVDSYMQPGEPAGRSGRYRWLIAVLVIVVLALAGVFIWWRVRHARRLSMPGT
jgi:hypothetical protein